MDKAIEILETLLYNAILLGYDDNITDYHGLDDKEFVSRVCNRLGITEPDYKNLINNNTENCSWNNEE